MIFEVRLDAVGEGAYEACCYDPQVTVRGLSRSSALERLSAEIRYRIEMCPCSSVDDDYVQLRVEE